VSDNLDAQSRALVMARNRGSGGRSTERRLRALLAASGFSGWKLGHRLGLPGRPDFVFPLEMVAVFVDGCFWHGCSRCRSIPITNRSFWAKKITGNAARDRRVSGALRRRGWRVVRVWEHELRSSRATVLSKIRRGVSSRSRGA
jgi:DNA mismatch endonuclease, patch repair protein